MHSTYRLLAPAPASDGSPEPNGIESRKRKKKARLACDQCRLKRIGCDSVRPECARCTRAGTPCVYLSDDAGATPMMALKSKVENLQRRLEEHVDFLESIRNAPEDEALSLVRQLRSTDNVSALLSSYKGRIGGTGQFSEDASPEAAIPSIGSGIESELPIIQPTAYPFFASPNPSSVTSASPISGLVAPSVATPSGTKSLLSSEPHAYCDLRLEHLAVKFWTQIPIDDRLAARAISHFLELDHHVLGFFDADLFVHDLVHQGLTFCSSFLFSSIMAIACQSYSTIDIRTTPYSFAFLEEAIKLWRTERSTDSTTTLAALNCLSVATGWGGGNELENHQLVADAREMATRLRLINTRPTDGSVVQSHHLDGTE